MMETAVVMYSSANCPYCVWASRLLDEKHIPYTEIRVDDNPALREEMIQRSGRRTVPQIFIHGKPIGGFDDLRQLDQTGKLDELLKTS